MDAAIQPSKPARRYFELLDGIRGVAALMVILYHVHDYFHPITAQESYLAVDLFFVLSGVVIANSYARRLANGMGFLEFAWVRYVRLYPFYLLGLALGLVALTLGHPPDVSPIYAVVFGLLLLPNIAASPMLFAFPLNPASWSLFFELLANFAYALTVRRLNKRALISIMTLSALGMAFALVFGYKHTLDLGWRIHNFAGGAVRVGYSFFAGVLLHRIDAERQRPPIAGALGTALSALLLLTAALLLKLGPADNLKPYFDFFIVVAVFPALTYLAMHCQPSPALARLCSFLGAISYGIYVLHSPLKELLDRVFDLAGHGAFLNRHAPWTGMVFVAALVPLVWYIDRVYDAPVRRALLAARKRQSPSADAAGT